MKIIIGSKNPAKVMAVKIGFSDYNDVDVVPIDVPSGVKDQPFSDEETIQGAINRANAALIEGDGQIGIGLEGGVQQTEYGLFLCNWGALVSVHHDAPLISGGARILLPEEIAQQLIAGEELGPVMDAYTRKRDVRSNEGAIGIFTNSQVIRPDMFLHIVKLLKGQYEYQSQIKNIII